MVFEFIKQPIVMMLLCALIVFGEMFIAKKWYINLTAKIDSVTGRRAANVGLGIATCLVLALSQMALLCDVFAIAFLWQFAIASAFIATGIYLVLEKIFTESKVNEVGKIFCDVISHSDKFDGNITSAGMVDVAHKMYDVVKRLDDGIASKESKTVDAVVAKLDEFLSDGKITEAEKIAAQKIVVESGVDTSLLSKYKNLLSK